MILPGVTMEHAGNVQEAKSIGTAVLWSVAKGI